MPKMMMFSTLEGAGKRGRPIKSRNEFVRKRMDSLGLAQTWWRKCQGRPSSETVIKTLLRRTYANCGLYRCVILMTIIQSGVILLKCMLFIWVMLLILMGCGTRDDFSMFVVFKNLNPKPLNPWYGGILYTCKAHSKLPHT